MNQIYDKNPIVIVEYRFEIINTNINNIFIIKLLLNPIYKRVICLTTLY